MIWYKEKNENDIIISTRIRLARNLLKYPFPNAMTEQQEKSAVEETESQILSSQLASSFKAYRIGMMNAVEKRMLYEKHLISPDMLGKANGAVMISSDDSTSIMLMEEDHLRIQVILGGFRLDEAYLMADKVDDALDKQMKFAFDEELGYLTSCPTNTGTGLRASVMMHLPALTLTDNISKIITSASKLGITVRGLYGEGSKAYGSLYQISNQVTLGLSEGEIIEKVKNIVNQIASHEKEVRQKLEENNKDILEDKLFRAYGTLRYARKISSQEAKSLISDVILGENMGIIPTVGQNLIELMILTEPASVESIYQKTLTPDERDIKRAELIRQVFDN